MWLRECETQPEETQKSVHQTKEVLFSEEEANVVGYQKQKMSSKMGFFPITKKGTKDHKASQSMTPFSSIIRSARGVCPPFFRSRGIREVKLHYGRDGRDSSGNMREKKKQRRMNRSKKAAKQGTAMVQGFQKRVS